MSALWSREGEAMRYSILCPNEEQRIDLADGATPADLRWTLKYIRGKHPDFWRHWRVVSYEIDGEETWRDAGSIIDAS